MDTKIYPKSEYPDPIQERIGEDMFTDREEEMDFLMDWASIVAQKRQNSIALVSPRRYGKTAILERFYNRIFWERNDIVPFYYELRPDPIYIREFMEDYHLAFLRQFLAYRIKNVDLAFKDEIDLDALYELAKKSGEELVTQAIDRLPYWQEKGHALFFKMVRGLPHGFAAETGLSVIVMFDEFQRLDQVLCSDKECQKQYHHPLTRTFASDVESAWAPMLIAGSQMTILTRQALGKDMAGRVGNVYLKRMTREAAAELALKLAKTRGMELSITLSYIVARLAREHPYYVWCLFNSRRIDRGLKSEEDVQERLKFEIENDEGRINGFWREHFLDNMNVLNQPYAKQIIFYLMKQPTRETRVDDIVDDLGLTMPQDEVNRLLRELVRGDLIRQVRLGGVYGSVNDPMLERVLRVEYSWELQNVGAEKTSAQLQLELAQEVIEAQAEMIEQMRGELNNWVGRIAEAFIEKLMKGHFKGQSVNGEGYFHHAGEVKLSRFKRVYSTFTQPFGATRPYQIDLYGLPENEDELPWVVESKNWQKPVDKPTVEHFLRAAENLALEHEHEQVIRWFYSRSGFTQPAQALLKEKGVFYTKQAQLIQMMEDFELFERWDL